MDNYTKSNKIVEVSLNKFRSAEYLKMVNHDAKDAKERYKCTYDLLHYLCDKFNISMPRLIITDRIARHTIQNGVLKSKVLGSYQPFGKTITLYNLTPMRKQIVSSKSLTGTLLHEFMHHYDYEVLKMSQSLHTKGFYMRISDLENKLKK